MVASLDGLSDVVESKLHGAYTVKLPVHVLNKRRECCRRLGHVPDRLAAAIHTTEPQTKKKWYITK